MFSGPASRCARIRGNPAQRDEICRRAGRKEARTSARKTAVRAKAAALERFSGLLLCRRWRAHQSASCDTTSGVPFCGPFCEFESALTWEVAPTSQLKPTFSSPRVLREEVSEALHPRMGSDLR